jgi:hypothetical protein
VLMFVSTYSDDADDDDARRPAARRDLHDRPAR